SALVYKYSLITMQRGADMADEKLKTQARPLARSRPVRRLLLGAFIVVVLLAGVGLYTQRHTIRYLLSGSDLVGGQAAATGLHLPPGFHATTFASGLNGPRFIAFAPDGVLYVA